MGDDEDWEYFTESRETGKKFYIMGCDSPIHVQLPEHWQPVFSRQESRHFLPEKFKQTNKKDLKMMTFPPI